MNNSELIVAILKRAGVRYVFGVPSGPTLPIMEALRESSLDYVLVAHEATAGFMADVTGRLTGTPGVCISTLGPGATNLATGVGNALLDSAPLLAFTCTYRTDLLHRRVQMLIDHQAFFAPLTKASFCLEAGKVGETLVEAINLAVSEPPGPVHLDFPEDVATSEVTELVPELFPPKGFTPPAIEDLGKVEEALVSSRKPIAVLGLSTTRSNARKSLLSFIERWKLPFVTTLMAKGYLPDDHPLNAGVIGRARRTDVRLFTDQADLVLGVGYDVIEINYEEWIRSGVNVASVDYRMVDADESVLVRSEAVGDLKTSIQFLSGLTPVDNDWKEAEIIEHRSRFERNLRPIGYGFAPHEAIDVLQKEFPDDGLMVYDVGGHLHQLASQWIARNPLSALSTNGWSSMGYAIPAALAAKLSQPERPVMAILGDGCFQMTVGEMATAKRLGLSIPFIVLNDGDLGLIRVKQERKRYGIYGVDLVSKENEGRKDIDPPPHYFGVPCVVARSSGELRKALKAAFEAGGPTVIEVFIDGRAYSKTIFDE